MTYTPTVLLGAAAKTQDYVPHLATVTNAEGEATTYDYSGNEEIHLATVVKPPSGKNDMNYEYDANADVEKTTNARGGRTELTRGGPGNQVKVSETHFNGKVGKYEYKYYSGDTAGESSGRLEDTIHKLNNQTNTATTEAYDPFGRVATATDYEDREVVYNYFDNGQVKKVEGPFRAGQETPDPCDELNTAKPVTAFRNRFRRRAERKSGLKSSFDIRLPMDSGATSCSW